MFNQLKNKLAGLNETFQFDNWIQIIVDRTLFRAKLVIYRYRGMDVLIDHSAGDANGLRNVLSTSMYAKWLTELNLPMSICVVDLGANAGAFPLLLRGSGYSLRNSVCVEMNSKTFERMHFNLVSNFERDTITVLNLAVAGTDGSIDLYPSGGSTSDSIDNLSKPILGQVPIRVECISLHTLLTTYLNDQVIDLCKIDIEGAEYEVILACPDECLRRLSRIIIEVHRIGDGSDREKRLLSKLTGCGFREFGGRDYCGDCYVTCFVQGLHD